MPSRTWGYTAPLVPVALPVAVRSELIRGWLAGNVKLGVEWILPWECQSWWLRAMCAIGSTLELRASASFPLESQGATRLKGEGDSERGEAREGYA